MLRLLIRLGLILLILNQFLAPCSALKSTGRNYGKYDRGYKDPAQPKTLAGTSAGLPGQNASRRGLGMSAWGIVLLIVSLIVAGMGFYYFSVCYPMCKSHNTSHKYDKMTLPTMA